MSQLKVLRNKKQKTFRNEMLGILFSSVVIQGAFIAIWTTRNFSKPLSYDPLNFPPVRQYELTYPIYYTNLDRSTARRAHMERTFGHWGRLIRFPAVDVNDEAAVNATVDTGGVSAYDYFVKRGGANGPGAGALLLSKALAAKKAYDDGEELMLLLEDDMSDMLVPFWRYSLEDLVKLADQHQPGWYFIQLQTLTKRPLYKSWKLDPKNPFIERSRVVERAHPWGCGAVLLSRDGMKMLIDRLFVGKDGKFDCVPEVWKNRGMRCHPDNFLWRFEELSKILLVMPPLFTYMINEGSTGIRGREKLERDLQDSDHEQQHFRASMLSLEESLVSLAERYFQRDFGVNETAKEARMWYMDDLDGLDKVLNDFVVEG